MTSSSTSRDRAAETFDTLCSLYRSVMAAQAILNGRISGATNPRIVRLVTYILAEPNHAAYAKAYASMWSLGGGYRKLMTACRGNRRMQKLVALAGGGRHLTAKEIDTAVAIVCRIIDAENGR